ncbi:hypothetical protein [Pseudidiomarina salinarum]|uniref:hypothetical protein n=1 Tax=Pseudidiomarina salinarum TaxID=435908 RepID=UPI000F8655CA|nr:hypothetical protein [Pseudidiomarina salinarum]
MPATVWGVDSDTAVWVQLDDLDQCGWRTEAPILMTPWCAVFRVSNGGAQRRWLWFWRAWMSESDYRRLSRLLCLWREHR